MYINGPNKAIFARSEPLRRTGFGDGKDSIRISYNMPVIGGSAGVGPGNPIGGNANAGSDLPLANTQAGTETTPPVDGSTITTEADTSTTQSSVSANTSMPNIVTSGAPLTTTPASSAVPTPTSRMSSTQVPQPSVQVKQGQTTAAASTSGSTNSSKSLPGAAIAGVVFGVLFFALAIGVLVFRRWAIRKRSNRRQIWVSKPFVVSTTTTVLTDKPSASAATRDLGAAAGETGASAGSSGNNNNNLDTATVVPRFNLKIPRVKPPPLSLLSVPGPGYVDLGSGLGSGSGSNVSFSAGRRLSSRSASPNSANSSLMVQMNSAPPTMYGTLTNVGVVRCIFEPRLPDELRIRVGEALRVLAEYDDGWGLCENTRGERGMVPFECLDRGMEERGERISISGMARFTSERLTMPAVSSTRNLRKSSLPALV